MVLGCRPLSTRGRYRAGESGGPYRQLATDAIANGSPALSGNHDAVVSVVSATSLQDDGFAMLRHA